MINGKKRCVECEVQIERQRSAGDGRATFSCVKPLIKVNSSNSITQPLPNANQ